jgi:hypothetical protein
MLDECVERVCTDGSERVCLKVSVLADNRHPQTLGFPEVKM